jgi:trehalose 6-phosphate phosphatase
MQRRIQRLAKAARSSLAPRSGIEIEDKTYSLAFHYRRSLDPITAYRDVRDFLGDAPDAQGLDIEEGKMVVEVRPPSESNKGTVLRDIVEKHQIKSALVFGDDLTDVDSFRMLGQLKQEGLLEGYAVAVSDSGVPASLLAAANFKFTDAEAVEIFLTWMAALITDTKET